MKHAISKILLSFFLVSIQINGMDDKPRPNVEYGCPKDPYNLLEFAREVRDEISKRGINNVPRSNYDDAQAIYIWILEHNTERSRVHVPKATLAKLLNRLKQLGKIYCPEDLEPFKNSFSILNADDATHLKGYFHREINFSTSSSNFSNQLFTLAQNRLVIAGGGIVAVAAAWYWFYYLHEPKTEETDSTEPAEQPKIIEGTK
jgi:hypothetical protein